MKRPEQFAMTPEEKVFDAPDAEKPKVVKPRDAATPGNSGRRTVIAAYWS